MGRAVLLVLVGVLCLGACGGDEDDAADTSAASTTARRWRADRDPLATRRRSARSCSVGSDPAEGRVDDRQRHRRIRGVRRRREKRGRVWPKSQFAGSLHVYWNRHAIDTKIVTDL